MPSRPLRLKLKWQDADLFISAVHSQSPVDGLTHNFYKYPARFSPEFAGAAIEVFTEPGDLLLDPFVGGGTTLVEARVRGRRSAGADISSLATFVSRAKTQVLRRDDIEFLQAWCTRLPSRIDVGRKSSAGSWGEIGYTRNLTGRSTWAIRKAIEIALASVGRIEDRKRQAFARCVVLRAAQWAIDGRKRPATVQEFRLKLAALAESHICGAHEYSRRAVLADRDVPASGKRRTICLNNTAEDLAELVRRKNHGSIKLIVTSPPYPGVHVLYHRWQVHGGKETPAPFWIANRLDGSGEAYYLMYARKSGLEQYFSGLNRAYSALARSCGRETVVVQLLAFSDPPTQLPQYLNVMESCGFREYLVCDHVDTRDGRVWRKVPGRRWHANHKGELGSGTEVVLIHKLA